MTRCAHDAYFTALHVAQEARRDLPEITTLADVVDGPDLVGQVAAALRLHPRPAWVEEMIPELERTLRILKGAE